MVGSVKYCSLDSIFIGYSMTRDSNATIFKIAEYPKIIEIYTNFYDNWNSIFIGYSTTRNSNATII